MTNESQTDYDAPYETLPLQEDALFRHTERDGLEEVERENSAPPATAPVTHDGPPGLILRAQREQLGLTPQEVARELYLDIKIVHALEQEDFGSLPAVFVQGYLRSYAKLLKLDPEPLVQEYLGTQPNMQPRFTPKFNKPQQTSTKSPWVRAQTYVLILILMLLMALWRQTSVDSSNIQSLWNDLTTGGETSPPSPVPTAPELSRQDIMLPPQGYVPPVETNGEEPRAGVDVGPTPPAPAVAVAPPEPTPPPAPPPNQIYIRYNESCWTSIVDAAGKSVYSKTARKDEEVIINDGKPPYRFSLGNPGAVAVLEVQGVAQDLTKFSGTVAKFTAGQAPQEAPQ